MQRRSQACIRDVVLRERILRRLGSPWECNAVVIEALPSGKLDRAFPVRDGNVDVLDCNVVSTI